MMKYFTGPSILWLSLCLIPVCPAQPQTPQQPPPEEPIAELIERLGSDVPEVREKATEQLLRRPEAAPELRKALKSADAEVARRASQILDAFAERESSRALDKLKAFAKQGQADRLVEWLVRQPKDKNDDASWQVVSDIAKMLIAATDKPVIQLDPGGSDECFPFGDFARYRAALRPQFVIGRNFTRRDFHDIRCVIRAEEVSYHPDLATSLIVSAGHITSPRSSSITNSIILANGPIDSEALQDSVVVCDGDVTARGCKGCIIVARGKVRCLERASDSLVVTSSTFQGPEKPFVTSKCTIREREAEPLGRIHFFDPAREGIEVVSEKGTVSVKTATKGKAFARAGIRPGDVVLAVDEGDVASVESFRKLLRRAVATQSEVSLKVRRDGEIRSLNVLLRD